MDASGEVAELKDNINQMIDNLRETTRANQEQDWLKTNLARISGLMQGRRDLHDVAELIMSELTPLVVRPVRRVLPAADGPRGDGRRETVRLRSRSLRLPARAACPTVVPARARRWSARPPTEKQHDPGRPTCRRGYLTDLLRARRGRRRPA